jgi:hypothetical protein
MGFWWFGRKSGPADARPFVPSWLTAASDEEGFARNFEGVTVYVRSTGTYASYRAAAWEIGVLRGTNVVLGGQQVIGSRVAAILSASGGTIVDSQARLAIDQILAAMRQHGLIET